MRKRTIAVLSVTLTAIAAIIGWTVFGAEVKAPQHQQSTKNTSQSQQTAPNDTPPPTGFDKARYSTADSSSLWVIANKKHPLSKGYAPTKLVVPDVPLRLEPTAEQMQVSSVIKLPLETMFAAAKKDGIQLKLSSGYRSEALQTSLYNAYVAKDGQAAADTYSARPGTSEHQTGLAADIIPIGPSCHLEVCFADTAEGKWLATHAHEYGFIIRYLKDKQAETTYMYEPWHIRYVGNDLASELYKNNQTMEAFFGVLN